MIRIPLTKGKFALIDDEDLVLISNHTWYFNTGYACTNAHDFDMGGKLVALPMHRLIMDPPKHMDVDHINGNRLDNRKSNLRICTRSQNLQNSRKSRTNPKFTSKFKGVSRTAQNDKWATYINLNGIRRRIGTFNSEKEAALAYDSAAKEAFGEFAWLNFPERKSA